MSRDFKAGMSAYEMQCILKLDAEISNYIIKEYNRKIIAFIFISFFFNFSFF